MKRLTRALTAFFLLLTAFVAHAQQANARQDHVLLRQSIADFLQKQTTGMPGEVGITIGNIDPRLNLAACPSPQPFFPHNNRAWGKTTVGIRCTAPATWVIYVPATVTVWGEYIAAAVPFAPGQTIREQDITKVRGDLTKLPAGYIASPAQAVGQITVRSVPIGAPLRPDALRSQRAVQQGQAVRLISAGPGFRVSAEGIAQANANEGQSVSVKTNNGQVVSGTAKNGGIVEVNY